jgi:hypothetical protein
MRYAAVLEVPLIGVLVGDLSENPHDDRAGSP